MVVKRETKSGASAPVDGARALASVRERLEAIPVDEVDAPRVPVDRLVGEALALAVTANRYREVLLSKGLDEDVLDGLSTRAHALAEAQSVYVNDGRAKRSEAELALEETATELRSEMIADGRFALRKNRAAQEALDQIQEGDGLDDKIQDLKDVGTFFGTYAAELERVGAKPRQKAARARKIAEELSAMVSARRGSTDDGGAKDERDRAATYLEDAMSEVRAAGAYAFRKNPRVLTRFRSAYQLDRRARGTKKKPEPPGV